MIECPNCNKPNSDGRKFCGYCGSPLKELEDEDLLLLKAELEPKDIQVEKKLGQGGMATVYLAEQMKLDRKVVIKLLSGDLSKDKEMRERFMREARTAAKIKHPNIVDIIDVGIAEGRPYFIMEFGEKGSIDDLLQKNKNGLPVKDAITYVRKALRGLQVAHDKGVVHRDIKPENILIRENGEPFLVDFGIAKASTGTVKTQTGLTMGTASYMSPEQCAGDPNIDHRSDIYSCGIMLYQLLTGELPFSGEVLTVINKHVREKMPNITGKMATKGAASGKIDNIPIKELDKIIQKACEKDKTKRYASAGEMASVLEALVNPNIKYETVKEKSQKEKENEYIEILRVVYDDGIVSETERNTLNDKIIELGLTLDKAKILEAKIKKEKGIKDNGTLVQPKTSVVALKPLILSAVAIILLIGGYFGFNFFFKNGNIQIITNPSGANVVSMITGKIEGKTPFYTTKNEPGTYEYAIKLEGYQNEEVIIRLKDVNTIEKKELTLKDLRNASIDTTPSGATIKASGTNSSFLDGKTTPLKAELKEGKYELTFQKTGYIDEKLSISISKNGEIIEKNIKLFTEAEISKKKEEELKRAEESKKQIEERQLQDVSQKKQACENEGNTWNGSSCVAPPSNTNNNRSLTYEGWAGSPENTNSKPYDYFYATSPGNASPKAIQRKSGAMMHETCIDSAIMGSKHRLINGMVGQSLSGASGIADSESSGHVLVRELASTRVSAKECRPLATANPDIPYSEWAECECKVFVKVDGGRDAIVARAQEIENK